MSVYPLGPARNKAIALGRLLLAAPDLFHGPVSEPFAGVNANHFLTVSGSRVSV
jgi:hypothetical protein